MRGMICAKASAQAHATPAVPQLSGVLEPIDEAGQSRVAHHKIPFPVTHALRSVTIAGPVGRLEGLLNKGAADAPFAALVCHPHPLGGGTIHNKVVYHAMKVLNRGEWGRELPVLRFNFRGVGLSEGRHDGEAEFEDVLAALDWLEQKYARPIVVAGFSFGAAMALKACCGSEGADERVRAIAALGLPTQVAGRSYRYSNLEKANLPKLFISGERDEFARPEQLESVAATAAEPKRLVLIPGADHFFTHKLSAMQQAFSEWLKEQLI